MRYTLHVLSPYNVIETPRNHPVSARALAALTAYAALALLAVREGAIGVPSRSGATVVDQPLEASRVAAVLHLILAVFAHVFAYPLWSGLPIPPLPDRDHDDRDHDAELVEAPDRAWTPPTQPRLIPAVAWSCVAMFTGTLAWSIIIVSFSITAAAKPLETAHLGFLLASFTLAPGAARHGFGPGSFWEWQRVLAWGGAAFVPVDFLWFGGAWGSLAGAWMGAIPIPLDWDRPWQRWPVSCVAGASAGFAAGTALGWAWIVGKWGMERRAERSKKRR